MPPRYKTVTQQTLIGEGGVALIARRVNEMGYLWHERRVDHGIDGEIELVGPDRSALNLVVMVQSKARDRQFSYETDAGFRWTAAQADLDYWLSGNAPVIVVLSRPAEDQAWWFDVRAEFTDPRRRAKRTVTIDKHRQGFDRSAAEAIMRTAVPRGSGIYLASPPKREILTTNLLPVEDWPQNLYIVPAAVQSYSQGWKKLRETAGVAPGWVLSEGMIASFDDPAGSSLRELCSGEVQSHESAEWADSIDQRILQQFSDLLRRTLVADYRQDLRWHSSRRHLHFRATRDLHPRVIKAGNGQQGEMVFSAHYASRDTGRVSYYHHAALKPAFRRLGSRWFCQLETDYCFTSDGIKESPLADNLLTRIKQHHPALRDWTRTWESYLKGGQAARNSRIAFGTLLTFGADRGIDDSWWGPELDTGSDDDDDQIRMRLARNARRRRSVRQTGSGIGGST
jgi:Domain of unknown function (DUF4365)